MGIQCLILTHDAALLSALRVKCSEFGLGIIMRKDAASAIEISKRCHLDGFIIDCDDVPEGVETLSNIRSNPANKRPVILAIVNGGTSFIQACEMGANFVLRKPVQDTSLAT